MFVFMPMQTYRVVVETLGSQTFRIRAASKLEAIDIAQQDWHLGKQIEESLEPDWPTAIAEDDSRPEEPAIVGRAHEESLARWCDQPDPTG